MGESDSAVKSVSGFGTAMHNVSASLVVVSLKFDTTVVSYIIAILLISLVILMPATRELGKGMSKAANGELSATEA